MVERPAAERRLLRARLAQYAAVLNAPRPVKVLTRPHRVALIAAGRLMGRLGGAIRVQVHTFWGRRLTVALPEIISEQIVLYGVFDPDVCWAMLDWVAPGSVVCDVGAHLGYYTLLAADLTGPGGAVHAFEPSPGSYELLVQNASPCPHVVTNPAALGAVGGTASLVDFGHVRWSWNQLVHAPDRPSPASATPGTRLVAVPQVTLDDYANERGIEPKFIKIDAQGSELQVLKGAERILATTRPAICLEMFEFEDPAVPPARALLEWLLAQGYEPWEYQGEALVRHQPMTRYPYMNLLFLPR